MLKLSETVASPQNSSSTPSGVTVWELMRRVASYCLTQKHKHLLYNPSFFFLIRLLFMICISVKNAHQILKLLHKIHLQNTRHWMQRHQKAVSPPPPSNGRHTSPCCQSSQGTPFLLISLNKHNSSTSLRVIYTIYVWDWRRQFAISEQSDPFSTSWNTEASRWGTA